MLQDAMKIPAGEPGAISVTVPNAQQKVLLSLIENKDVRIIDKEGQLVLYQPPSGDDPGGMINIQEMLNYEATGKTFFETVPDLSGTLEGAATNIIGSKKVDG